MGVSDLGGGIPFDVGDRVWDFLYSGWADSGEEATALAGFGLGLPLARLYARYLGGSLSLVSLPDYGVDTYIFLPRIDVTEVLKDCTGPDCTESKGGLPPLPPGLQKR